jgi:nicotinate-nucleotide adenylyltransferase
VSTSCVIGLLGGSFDPVHLGHLALASAAQDAFDFDRLLFIPAAQPWQKRLQAPASLRQTLLAMALRDHAQWQVEPCEMLRTGPTYTIDTLADLRHRFGASASLIWLMGADQFERLPTWHRWRDVLDACHIAWVARSGPTEPRDPHLQAELDRRMAPPTELRQAPSGKIASFPMPALDCSSTGIRRALADHRFDDAVPFLPAAVAAYLRSHPVYAH